VVANLSELVQRNALGHPDDPALVDSATGERLSWAEAEDRVSRLASGLRALGVTPGQRVLLALGNRTEWALVYFASLRARLIVAPTDPRSPVAQLVDHIVATGAALVVADEGAVASVRDAVGSISQALSASGDPAVSASVVPRILTVGTTAGPGEVGYSDLMSTEPVSFPRATDAELVAVLLATRGREGEPRLATLTHRALLANIEQVQALDPPPVTGSDLVLGVLPMFHVYGLNAVLGVCLGQAATLLLTDRFEVEGTLDLITEHGVTVVPVAPPVFAYWRAVDDLRARLASVRVLLSGSAPVHPGLVEEFEARTGIRVLQGYGLTEAAPVVTLSGPGSRPDSVGRPVPGVELRLRDVAEPGESDPAEILIRGDNLFSGYWPDGADGPDEDGWFATGDIGYLDDGELFLVDRAKGVIVVSGFNVYPREVEETIRQLEYVDDVTVVGRTDSVTGEAVVAYVRRSPATTRTDSELAEDVLAHCREQLAAFKRPSVVVVSEELPSEPAGRSAMQGREARRRTGSGLIE
jgi:long-chain acyl-CoA synthetase